MSNELKPCPFCGGEAKLCETTEREGLTYCGFCFVKCTNCGCRTQMYADYCPDIVKSLWNRRAANEV